MSAKLSAILIKRAHRGPIDNVGVAQLIAGRGIAGNADRGGRRQVTFLSLRAWYDHTAGLGPIDPSVRRANLLVDDLDFTGRRGHTLRVGSTAIRINGETRPCRTLDFSVPGLLEALKKPWAAGAYGEVIEGGDIRVGDAVVWDQLHLPT